MSLDPTPITNWLLLFIAISTVVGLFARWIAKGAKRRELSAQKQRDEMVVLIKEVTRQIQPTSNGGYSLTDVAKGVRELRAHQAEIGDQLRGMDERFTARMDESDRTRARIMAQVAEDQAAWAAAMAAQGIDTPAASHIEPVAPKRRSRARKVDDTDGMQ